MGVAAMEIAMRKWMLPITATMSLICGGAAPPDPMRDSYNAEFKKMQTALHEFYLVTPRGSGVRRSQEAWEQNHKVFMFLANPDPARISLIQERTRQIEAWRQEALRLADRQFSFSDIAQRCIELPPPEETKPAQDCLVQEFGRVERQNNLRYQIYDLSSNVNAVLPSGQQRAIAVFADQSGNGGYRLVAWATGTLNPPVLAYNAAGTTVMVFPDVPYGSGGWAYDKVFLDEGPEHIWRELDAMHWVNDFSNRLPKGLSPRAPVINYGSLTADILLERPSDPHCCPTGGNASVSLKVVDRRLAVESWRWLPPKP